MIILPGNNVLYAGPGINGCNSSEEEMFRKDRGEYLDVNSYS